MAGEGLAMSVKCPYCSEDINASAKKCKHCGEFLVGNDKADAKLRTEKIKKKHPILYSICVVALFGAIYYGVTSFVNNQARDEGKTIMNQVADDAVKQYDIAKQGGDKSQICVQAGLVVAGYLQAQDSANYQKWQQIKSADCAAAGLSSQ